MLQWLGVVRELADNPSKRRRMRSRQLTMYSTYPSDPRETSGPRMDRILPARPPWRRRQFRELKKLIFLAPSKCPIDLFGSLANGRILKRLHGFQLASVLHAASCLFLAAADEAAAAKRVSPAAFQTSYDTRAAEAKCLEQRYDACDSFF